MLPHHRSSTSTSHSRPILSFKSIPITKLLTRWTFFIFALLTVLWLAVPFYEEFVHQWGLDLDGIPQLAWPHPHPQSGPHRIEVQVVPHTHVYSDEDKEVWKARREEVKEAFKHAWNGYKTRAFPADELSPVSGGRTSKYNGWSLTLFDSLDTMWIMGLKDEFKDAVDSIRTRHFNSTMKNHQAPFFETTIRYLGGLLSAYALSKEPILLSLADELGQILLPVFLPSGLPAFSVGVESGKPDNQRSTILFAEAATCQLEFKYLAKLTGKKEYYQKAEGAMDVFYRANVSDGLFHDNWLLESGNPTGSHFTVGATADSGYEYLLKQWVQSGDVKALGQYIKSSRGIIQNLIYLTPNRSLMYIGDLQSNRIVHRMEHLSCFFGGLLTLGAAVIPVTPSTIHPSTDPMLVFTQKDREMHKWAGEGLTRTCSLMYLDQKTGLAPDEVSMGGEAQGARRWVDVVGRWEFGGGKDGNEKGKGGVPGLEATEEWRERWRVYLEGATAEGGEEEKETDEEVVDVAGEREYWNIWANSHQLRPETIESIFYMYRTTHDLKWRRRGYRIFQSLEKYAKVKYGYSSLDGVDREVVWHKDYMPSWFLAETLKYLYLLFDDDSELRNGTEGVTGITFDKWVFNTEAHPLPVFEWTEEERRKFGIGIGEI